MTEEALIRCATEHCVTMCDGMEEALLIQDTTELNLEAHREWIRDRAGLGEWLEQTAPAYEYRMEVIGDKRGRKKRTALLTVK